MHVYHPNVHERQASIDSRTRSNVSAHNCVHSRARANIHNRVYVFAPKQKCVNTSKYKSNRGTNVSKKILYIYISACLVCMSTCLPSKSPNANPVSFNFDKAFLPGAAAETNLWQVQLAGDGSQGAFAYRITTVMKDAVLEHPNPAVRSLQDVEKVLGVRLILGAPAQGGPSDPDDVGFLDWQLVIYSCGLDAALNFIHFILEFKLQKRYLSSMPQLLLHMAYPGSSAPPLALPLPWQELQDTSIAVPKPFNAMPPRTRRHVLVQLDVAAETARAGAEAESQGEAEDDGKSYALTFYGNIYPFKSAFEEHGVAGSWVAIRASEEKKDYVRFLELKMDDACKEKVKEVLNGILRGLPLYFINMVGNADPMACWLQRQPSILHTERQ